MATNLRKECDCNNSSEYLCKSTAWTYTYRVIGGIASLIMDICDHHFNVVSNEKPHWKLERV